MTNILIDCPNCGESVDIPTDDLELLHSGVSVDCPSCSEDIVFGVFSAGEWVQWWAKIVQSLTDLIVMRDKLGE